jgi:hypothetical protein
MKVDLSPSRTISEHAKMCQKVVIAVKHFRSSTLLKAEAYAELDFSHGLYMPLPSFLASRCLISLSY